MMDPVLENTLSVAGSGMEAKQLLLVYHQEDLEKLMQLPGLVITLELRMLLEDRHFLLGAGRKLGFEIAALGLELTTKEAENGRVGLPGQSMDGLGSCGAIQIPLVLAPIVGASTARTNEVATWVESVKPRSMLDGMCLAQGLIALMAIIEATVVVLPTASLDAQLRQ
mmetsp:Transcript_57365/g.83876  ORF Transcript_57365/g.83876 Transcript_57365/m.83876 type:complete len:168 (+) Transcript_57365:227-730(+)